MGNRDQASIRLIPEQAAQLRAIGRMETLAQPVRALAWLITRYSERLTTTDVARAVGVTPSSARYWRTRFTEQGMSIFARHIEAFSASGSAPERVICVEDVREHGGFDMGRVRFIEGVVNQLFDTLKDRHRLGEDSRSILEKAAAYHDLGRSAISFDEDGIFFTVLDPFLQRIPLHEQRLLATVVRYLNRKVNQKVLSETGLSRADKNHAMCLLALMKIALAVDASNTQRTRIRRIENAPRTFYLVMQGPEAATNAIAVEGAARLWTRVTGQRGRAFAVDGLRLVHEGVDEYLYRKRPRTTGMKADDRIDVAVRKVLRFQLVQMLRRESAAFIGDDPEGVHKMRVATRRIRSAFKVYAGDIDLGPATKANQRFRRLARALGKVRDLDVALMHLADHRAGLDEVTRAGLAPFADELRVQWLDAMDRLREFLRSAKYARLVRDFDAYTDATVPHPQEGCVRRARDAAPVHIYQALANVGAYEAGLQRLDLDELHELRIEFKRFRYTFEFYGDILGDSVEKLIDRIKSVQDHLGLLQDARFACELIDGYMEKSTSPDQGPSPELIAYREARASEVPFRADAFKNAWDQFVGPDFRRAVARCVGAL